MEDALEASYLEKDTILTAGKLFVQSATTSVTWVKQQLQKQLNKFQKSQVKPIRFEHEIKKKGAFRIYFRKIISLTYVSNFVNHKPCWYLSFLEFWQLSQISQVSLQDLN